MNRSKLRKISRRLLPLLIVSCLVIGLTGHWLFSPTYGAQLGNRSLQLSTSNVSASANYNVSFTYASAGNLGSIAIQFCSNDPLLEDPCTPPAGLDASQATLSSQTGETGFSISNLSTSNEVILTRPVAPANTVASSYTLSGVINPSSSGSYYARLQTFASTDATGPASDYGGLAFAITNNLSVNAEVPPYLIFCTGITITGLNCANANGDYIDMGELSANSTGKGTSQMLVATNAESGYGITLDGTTMTSGNNVINALSSNDVSRPGVAQFGLNLTANTTPVDGQDPTGPGVAVPATNYDQPNIYRFVPGDSVVSNLAPDNIREYTISYIANVPTTQPPGVYVSTVTYICLASF